MSVAGLRSIPHHQRGRDRFHRQAEGRGAAHRTRHHVLREGSPCEQLFTLLEGWAFRYKTLEDGRRQITSFVLPGDLVGIQSSMQAEMDHSVDTLTAAVLCTFPRERVWELYKGCPSLAFDLTWLAATQEMILNENLLSIGRRNAVECAAYYLLHLYLRAEDVGLVTEGKVRFPFTQEHLADALGLSLVHTNKTLQAAFRARPDAMGAWLVLHPRCRRFGRDRQIRLEPAPQAPFALSAIAAFPAALSRDRRFRRSRLLSRSLGRPARLLLPSRGLSPHDFRLGGMRTWRTLLPWPLGEASPREDWPCST